VAGGKENIVEVPMHSVPLTPDEIEKRWPFVVTGTVTDGRGRPVPGVSIQVFCGMGSMWPGGTTTTTVDGKYTLRFCPFVWHDEDPHTNKLITPDLALLYVHKSGHYERDHYPEHDWSAALSYEVPTARVFPGLQAIIAGKPCRKDFVMLPAASIVGRAVDPTGKPVANLGLALFDDERLTDVSRFKGFSTGADGRFTVTDLPRKTWWFAAAHGDWRETLTSNPLRFPDATTYWVVLTYDSKKPSLEAKILRPRFIR